MYVVAVSGGVDSVVLLDMLIHGAEEIAAIDPDQLIVAHFDHGIREDSVNDAEFVRGLAKRYGVRFETERATLGQDASEEMAREARYSFLRQICKNYSATLITAHHQDDLIETMLINLIRGTGWRGLVSLNSNSRILRPLLNTSKNELIYYANEHDLQWQEDSTNEDTKYLRNYVRHVLLPTMAAKDPLVSMKLLEINEKTKALKIIIATELQKIIPDEYEPVISRYNIIMWPEIVAKEVLYSMFTSLDPSWHPQSDALQRAVHFIKTGQTGKRMEVGKSLMIQIEKALIRFKKP